MPTSAVDRLPASGTRRCLELIRQVIPAPTVHARNLFHTSAAMWDAWAAYDPTADGYFVTEKHSADNVAGARETAISYAAYRILLWRYGTVSDLPAAAEQLDAVDGLAVLPRPTTSRPRAIRPPRGQPHRRRR